MINFAHIAPTVYLPLVKNYPVHLLLAHLVESDPDYRKFYIDLKIANPNTYYHLDNSAFEMFKRGVDMYPSDKLIEMGKLVGADSIVMSDYPKQHYMKTIESAIKLSPQFKDAGFDTFFVPQSEVGKLDDLMESFQWALEDSHIDYIGVSILACPIALGIDESTYPRHTDVSSQSSYADHDAYRLQRYLARVTIFQEMEKRGMLNGENSIKRFHCLGMTDGPREIDLIRPYHKHIFSWDSSSAVWHGINGIEYDKSPTGLYRGKCEREVDFNIKLPENSQLMFDEILRINRNINAIDAWCKGYK